MRTAYKGDVSLQAGNDCSHIVKTQILDILVVYL